MKTISKSLFSLLIALNILLGGFPAIVFADTATNDITSPQAGEDTPQPMAADSAKEETIYAVWEHDGETFYTIKYHENSGTGTGTEAKIIPEHSHTIYNATEGKVARYGYKLMGWATTASGGVTYSVGSSITPTRDMDLYAVWEHDGDTYYTISYRENGGTGTGTEAKVIPEHSHTIYNATQGNVTRYGYRLKGWATSAAGEVEYAIGATITPTKDIELFAVWEHDGDTYFKVTYHPGDGSGGAEAYVIPERSHTIYNATQASVSRYGYKLDGWATSATGEIVYTAGTVITPTDDIELFAVWSHDGETYFRVSYNANGGTGGGVYQDVIPEHSHTVYNASQASVSRYGYKLDGWATTPNGAVTYIAGSSFIPTANTTLFAVWSHDGETYYTVTYDPAEGEGGTEAKIIPEQSHIIYTATQAEVSRYGYFLSGWATREGGSVVYEVGATVTPVDDMTLYAVWVHDSQTYYRAIYNPNGGTGGAIDKIIPEESHTIFNQDQAKVYRFGHKVSGWALLPDADVTYTAGNVITPTDDVPLFAKWEHDGISYYTVTYHPNGGTGGNEAEIIPFDSHNIYDKATAQVDRYGFKLLGWSTTRSGNVRYQIGETIVPTEDMTLYAVWEHDGETYYNVTFAANGGSGGAMSKVIPGESVAAYTEEQANLYREGYYFQGWSRRSTGGVNYAEGAAITPTSDTTVYAVWEHDGITFRNVKFYRNDNTDELHTEYPDVKPGTYITKPADPERKGWILTGWYLDQECTEEFNFADTLVLRDLVLFAGWQHDNSTYYSVSYMRNDNTDDIHDIQEGVRPGEWATAPTEPERTGWIFVGWYADKECTDFWNFSTRLVLGDTILYAGWAHDGQTYRTATYYINDNTTDVYYRQYDIKPGEWATRPADPERTGWKFTGWYLDQECAEAFSFSSRVLENIELYAGWEHDDTTYRTATFYMNDNTTDIYHQQTDIKPGEWATRPTDPERTGWIFTGWYTNKICTIPFVFSTRVLEDIELYAGWQHDDTTYRTATFYMNDNTEDVYYQQTDIKPGELAIRPTDPERTGWTFTGWYLDQECIEPFSFSTRVLEDVELFAGWEHDSETYRAATFYMNDNTEDVYYQQTNIKPGEWAIEPTDPERTGWIFTGWYLEAECTTSWSFDTRVLEDVELYAGWEHNGETYRVATYYMNDNTSDVYYRQTDIKPGEWTTPPVDPERTGWLFTGWYTDRACTEQFIFSTRVLENVKLYAGWDHDNSTYRIATFYMNDNTEDVYYQQADIKPGEWATQPTDPVRTGWVFTGWYTDKECTEAFSFKTRLLLDIELYAGWEHDGETYRMATFYMNDNTMDIYHQQADIKPGEWATQPADPERTGWKFTGWYMEAKCTTSWSFDTRVLEDIVLYAGWEHDNSTYRTATLYMNDNTEDVYYHQADIKPGEWATRPADPERTGWVFTGWYMDAECTSVWSFDTRVLEDIALYAGWDHDGSTYRVATFYMNDNTTDVYNQQSDIKPGEWAIQPTDPERTGWVFTGWYLDQECTSVWSFDTRVLEDIALYAGWDHDGSTYRVATFYMNDNTTDVYNQQSDIKPGEWAIQPTDPGRTGWVFTGWYLDQECTSAWSFDTRVLEDINLYAGWEHDGSTHRVATFYMNDNTEDVYHQQANIKPGEWSTQPADPERTGWIFTGWYLEAECTTSWSFGTRVLEDIALYAGWEHDGETYRIAMFYMNNNTTDIYHQQADIKPGEWATQPTDPERTGWMFTGWYADQECTEAYNFSSRVLEDIDLYAGWEHDGETYRIAMFYMNNNTTDIYHQQADIKPGEWATQPTDPERTGWMFTGWYADQECTEAYNFSSRVLEDIDLYAGWEHDGETYRAVTFYMNDNTKGVYHQQADIKPGEWATRPSDPERTGWMFTGWYADQECTEAYNFSSRVLEDIDLYAGWKHDGETYRIATFYMNDNTTDIYHQQADIKPEEWATQPTDPERTGWLFTGWYLDQECTSAWSFDTRVLEDITLYAGWDHDGSTYRVATFYMNDNTEDIYHQQSDIKSGEWAIQPTDPERTGWIFTGWYADQECTEAFSFSTRVLEDIELYASWEHDGETYYHAAFYWNTPIYDNWNTPYMDSLYEYGLYEYQSDIKPGEWAIEPTNPELKGFYFTGWYIDQDCTELYSFSSRVLEDIELYAGWNHDGETYSAAIFYMNDNTDDIHIQYEQVIPGSLLDQPNIPERTGWIFCGWEVKQYGEETDYLWDFAYDCIFYDNLSFYAQWEHDGETYRAVTFYRNDGTDGIHHIQDDIKPGEWAQWPTIPQRIGYDFTGWYLDAECTQPFDFNARVLSDAAVYAGWLHDGDTYYSVKYNPNGGKGGTEAKIIPEHSHMIYNEAQAEISRFGYLLAGWATTASGEIEYKASDFITPDSDIELFAVWEHDPYGWFGVIYVDSSDEKGGAEIMVWPEEVHTIYTAELANISRDGYTFKGWARSEAGEVEYLPGDELVLAEGDPDPYLLYAVWEEVEQEPQPEAQHTEVAATGDYATTRTIIFAMVGVLCIIAAILLLLYKRKVAK